MPIAPDLIGKVAFWAYDIGMGAPMFHDLVTAITGDQTPRVWSLLVTVFGELAQKDGAAISGTLLGAMAERVGFKPEAVRVALFRLRKDGWITNRRTGRTSSYFLTPEGRARSAEATPRIYAARSVSETCWLVIRDPKAAAGTELESGNVWISPSIYLANDASENEGLLCLPLHKDTPLPDWVKEKLCPEELVQKADALLGNLSHYNRLAQASPKASALDTAVLRVLVVHEWRRIILRAPDLPDFAFPNGSALERCRAEVTRLLVELPPQTLDVLQAEALG